MVGYEPNVKGYRILTDDGKVIVAGDVTFDETIGNAQRPGATSVAPKEHVRVAVDSDDGGSSGEDNGAAAGSDAGDGASDDGADNVAPAQRYPTRQRRSPVEWWAGQQALGATAPGDGDPTTMAEALASDNASHWQQAMDEEIASLAANNTWTMEEVPPGVRAIPVKRVFKTKRNVDGKVERFKARLAQLTFRNSLAKVDCVAFERQPSTYIQPTPSGPPCCLSVEISPPTNRHRTHGRSEQTSTQRTMRTRSQGLASSVGQDLDRDLLLVATCESDPVVKRLVERYRCCITFRPKAGLNAWRNQILAVMLPSSGIAASALASAPASASAPPCPPPPSQPGHLRPSPTASVDRSPERHVVSTPVAASTEEEGLPRPLTCGTQCAGCLTLQSENARLQQAEKDASACVAMLEAELQHLRCVPDSPVVADTVASTEVEDSALVAESPTASANDTPPPPARARDWQVVVRGLPCGDIVTTAVLHSTFSQFCCDRLRLRADMRMSVLRRLTSRRGTAAGVVALHSQEDFEALFRATREHLTEDCPVSIAVDRIRAQRRALGEARQLRRTVVSQRRAGVAGGGAGSANHQPMHSSLRHDAPEFIPESLTASSQPVTLPCHVASLPDAMHQE